MCVCIDNCGKIESHKILKKQADEMKSEQIRYLYVSIKIIYFLLRTTKY